MGNGCFDHVDHSAASLLSIRLRMVTLVRDVATVNTVPYGSMSMRLSRQEWIDAGLKAMARDGVDAVRIERLAAALKVTKGSFYWHFKDRDALLEAPP